MFHLIQNFPDIVQVRIEASPQIDRLGMKCLGLGGRTQSCQTFPKGVVHDLLESDISRPSHLFE